jgi:hypothetical protein
VVSNIGNGRSFPNAVHSLCYIHLAIIGWCKHVTMPSVSDSSSLSDVAINTVQDWIKSWFFDVETKEEYVHSTGELLDFQDMSCENQVLPFYSAESIKTWLVGTLQKCESLWNNHERLYVESMNMRTTSVAESLHWSMKQSTYTRALFMRQFFDLVDNLDLPCSILMQASCTLAQILAVSVWNDNG